MNNYSQNLDIDILRGVEMSILFFLKTFTITILENNKFNEKTQKIEIESEIFHNIT